MFWQTMLVCAFLHFFGSVVLTPFRLDDKFTSFNLFKSIYLRGLQGCSPATLVAVRSAMMEVFRAIVDLVGDERIPIATRCSLLDVINSPLPPSDLVDLCAMRLPNALVSSLERTEELLLEHDWQDQAVDGQGRWLVTLYEKITFSMRVLLARLGVFGTVKAQSAHQSLTSASVFELEWKERFVDAPFLVAFSFLTRFDRLATSIVNHSLAWLEASSNAKVDESSRSLLVLQERLVLDKLALVEGLELAHQISVFQVGSGADTVGSLVLSMVLSAQASPPLVSAAMRLAPVIFATVDPAFVAERLRVITKSASWTEAPSCILKYLAELAGWTNSHTYAPVVLANNDVKPAEETKSDDGDAGDGDSSVLIFANHWTGASRGAAASEIVNALRSLLDRKDCAGTRLAWRQGLADALQSALEDANGDTAGCQLGAFVCALSVLGAHEESWRVGGPVHVVQNWAPLPLDATLVDLDIAGGVGAVLLAQSERLYFPLSKITPVSLVQPNVEWIQWTPLMRRALLDFAHLPPAGSLPIRTVAHLHALRFLDFSASHSDFVLGFEDVSGVVTLLNEVSSNEDDMYTFLRPLIRSYEYAVRRNWTLDGQPLPSAFDSPALPHGFLRTAGAPTRWSNGSDCAKFESSASRDPVSIFADGIVPLNAPIFYFEVTISEFAGARTMVMGLMDSTTVTRRQTINVQVLGYASKGAITGQATGQAATFSNRDTIGCGFVGDSVQTTFFFTKNGVLVFGQSQFVNEFSAAQSMTPYVTSSETLNAHVNFGSKPFMFPVASLFTDSSILASRSNIFKPSLIKKPILDEQQPPSVTVDGLMGVLAPLKDRATATPKAHKSHKPTGLTPRRTPGLTPRPTPGLTAQKASGSAEREEPATPSVKKGAAPPMVIYEDGDSADDDAESHASAVDEEEEEDDGDDEGWEMDESDATDDSYVTDESGSFSEEDDDDDDDDADPEAVDESQELSILARMLGELVPGTDPSPDYLYSNPSDLDSDDEHSGLDLFGDSDNMDDDDDDEDDSDEGSDDESDDGTENWSASYDGDNAADEFTSSEELLHVDANSHYRSSSYDGSMTVRNLRLYSDDF